MSNTLHRAHVAVALALMFASSPAAAHQWVLGNVVKIQDFTAYGSGDMGLLVSLTNGSWGSGTTSNGPTNCLGPFRLVVGQQGVTSDMKDRAWATFLMSMTTSQPIAFYVDTGSNPNCYIQIFDFGSTAAP